MSVDLTKRWALGFKNRGHGHGDFAVIEEAIEEDRSDDGTLFPILVLEVNDRELAEHLIELHNRSLEAD